MFQWHDVEEIDFNGKKFKMYRNLYKPEKSQAVKNEGLELDHIAHKYLGDEMDMYKILDTNITSYIEERGNVSRIEVKIPLKEENSAFVKT